MMGGQVFSATLAHSSDFEASNKDGWQHPVSSGNQTAIQMDDGLSFHFYQRSLIGSVFQASYALAPENAGGGILPEIRGAASISAVSQLVFDPRDPFPNGIPT